MSSTKPKKEYGRYSGAGIVLIVLIFFFLNMQGYLGHRVSPGTTPVAVHSTDGLMTVEVVNQDVEEFETAVGTVSARKETIISSKIPAHVKNIYVHPGKEVAAGDLLIELDAQDLKAKLGQAESGLEAAKAARLQAENSYSRFVNLVKTGAATQAEFENAEAQFHMSAARVKEAENAIVELRVMLGYTEIRAPYRSVVVEKMIEKGSFAAPGVPLFRLEDPENLRLEVFIPESRRAAVSIGKTLMVRIDTLDSEIPGKVDEIVPSADPRSRSFMVRISLTPNPLLKSGMFGRCYLPLNARSMILVDARSIFRIGQLEMVNVLGENGAEKRLIRSGSQRDNLVEVLSGLEPGDKVIIPNHLES